MYIYCFIRAHSKRADDKGAESARLSKLLERKSRYRRVCSVNFDSAHLLDEAPFDSATMTQSQIILDTFDESCYR